MITLQELLVGCSEKDVSLSQMANLQDLLTKMNKVRKAYGKPMYVTSGFRSMAKHLQIYKNLGKVAPMGSRHLQGQAADISDPQGDLMFWCQTNEPKLAEIGLWMEVPDEQKRVHFQTIAPKSGRRFFYP